MQMSMACNMRYRVGIRNLVRWKLADSFRLIRCKQGKFKRRSRQEIDRIYFITGIKKHRMFPSSVANFDTLK